MNTDERVNSLNEMSQSQSTPISHGGEVVIRLTEINKIYRTDEVETQALENVNIEVKKG